MISLYQFPSTFGLPNASPFCMKLESYIKAMQIPYDIKTTFDPRKSPTSKIPYISLDNNIITDSGLIIRKLEMISDKPMQAFLTETEKGISCAFIRLLEEHLYWPIVHSRWIDPEGANIWCANFQKNAKIPAIAFKFLVYGIKKNINKQLSGHGIGLHDNITINQLACEDIDALADFLGNNDFCFKDKPSLLDHSLYASIGSIIQMPWEYPLKRYTLSKKNLINHYHKMISLYFPEFNKDIH